MISSVGLIYTLLTLFGNFFHCNIIYCYKWIKLDEYGVIPPSVFIGGYEDGLPLYVTKLYFDFGVRDGTYPGKFKQNRCYISYYGKEYSSGYGCELLSDFKGSWKNISNPIPQKAVIGGTDEEFDILYIGRAKINDDIVIGKIQIEYDFSNYLKGVEQEPVLYFPYMGMEFEFHDEFEILVQD